MRHPITGRARHSTTATSGGGQGRVDRSLSCPCERRRAAGTGADRQFRRKGPPLGFWRQRGEQNQAIGRSRGGRTTKIHALTDRHCRPIAFLLTGGQVADCTAAAALLKQMPPARILHGDKGYDSNAVRRQVEEKGTMPNIPPRPTGAGNPVSRRCFTATAMPSSACSAALRTSGALPPATCQSALKTGSDSLPMQSS